MVLTQTQVCIIPHTHTFIPHTFIPRTVMPHTFIPQYAYIDSQYFHTCTSYYVILSCSLQIIEGEDHTRVSRINLIDLAGSERSALAMTSGDRLKVYMHLYMYM